MNRQPACAPLVRGTHATPHHHTLALGAIRGSGQAERCMQGRAGAYTTAEPPIGSALGSRLSSHRAGHHAIVAREC